MTKLPQGRRGTHAQSWCKRRASERPYPSFVPGLRDRHSATGEDGIPNGELAANRDVGPVWLAVAHQREAGKG